MPIVARIGRCIYCRETVYDPSRIGAKLGEEHIIPRGLGGTLTLEEASCKRHETITTGFETKCISHLVQHSRADLGIKGRKTKRLKAKVEPSVMVMYKFPDPSILAMPTSSESTAAGKIVISKVTPDFDNRLNQLGIPHVGQHYGHGGLSAPLFVKMLAKIAHATAVSRWGLDGFSPIATGIIDGTDKALMRLVGSEYETPPREECRHWLEPRWSTSIDGATYPTVRIRLFANLAMPVHLVVVGAPVAATRIADSQFNKIIIS